MLKLHFLNPVVRNELISCNFEYLLAQMNLVGLSSVGMRLHQLNGYENASSCSLKKHIVTLAMMMKINLPPPVEPAFLNGLERRRLCQELQKVLIVHLKRSGMIEIAFECRSVALTCRSIWRHFLSHRFLSRLSPPLHFYENNLLIHLQLCSPL